MKVKFCGLTNIEDAKKAEMLGADMLGFVVEPGQARQVSIKLLEEAKRSLSKPIVAVRIEPKFDELLSIADYVQIHRILKNDEIERLASYSARFILYVPSSKEGLDYIKNLDRLNNAKPLIDSPKKGVPTDLKLAKELLKVRPDSGLGGGITPENVRLYLELNPEWIDVSSGIESSLGKKDEEKMRRIIEAAKGYEAGRI
mgnify:FL=1